MENLIILLMQTRTLVHVFHLRTKGPGSYAAHMALGELYESLNDHIDTITEAYQGLTNSVLALNTFPSFSSQYDHTKQIREIFDAIESGRKCCNNSTIQNMIDELQGDILSALFKLQNLS